MGGDAQHVQPKSFQQLLSLLVRLSLVRVNGSVDLDDEPRFVAIEVYNEGSDWLLPAELEVSQLSISQRAPKHSLARLWLLPEVSSDLHHAPLNRW